MGKRTIFFLLAVILALVLACPTQTCAKPRKTQVYMFGVSASFTDSIAYMTQVQLMDPVYIESKTGFLYDRSIYSQQLQIFVERYDNRPNTTCAVFFSHSKSAMLKKYAAVKAFYQSKNEVTIKELTAEAFQFTPEEWTEHETAGKQDKSKRTDKKAKKIKIDGQTLELDKRKGRGGMLEIK